MSENLLAGTMAEMTATAVEAAARRQVAVLLPVGVIEAHGPHLPVGTDAFIALALCKATQRYAAAAGRETIIAPPYYWGINAVLGEFTGSFRIRAETARALLADVIASLIGNGFPEIHIISHHGDRAHNEMILSVLREVHGEGHSRVRLLYTPVRWKMIERLGQTGKEPWWVPWDYHPRLEDFRLTGFLGVHADEYETAAIVRYHPETVDFEALRNLAPTQLTLEDLNAWRTGGDAARRLTPDGYFGAPNPIDPELWRHYDETARIMAAAISPPC